jgi:adenylosuccinate synthase
MNGVVYNNRKGKIVVGSIWGDEGKGITTDFLCSRNEPDSTMVVRFSGGQNAGHNVIIDGISHIHSNFGSGTLRGVPSYFSHHCTIYPVTMFREAFELIGKTDPFLYKVPKPIEFYIHPLVNVTTPGDVAYNRLTAPVTNHGSCGIGVGATMKRNTESPHKVYGVDLLHLDSLKEKVHSVYKFYCGLIGNNPAKLKEFRKEYASELLFFNRYIKKIKFQVEGYEFLKRYPHIIFEGSQGILLDMDHGIFPNVTYANTTSKNAIEIARKIGIEDIEVFYVTRCYQTRHGAGWMSNNDDIELINTEDEINKFNEWQKDFKVREIDYDLLNQAFAIDNIYSEGIPKNLVVTCLDQREDFAFDYYQLKSPWKTIYNSYSAESKDFVQITAIQNLEIG